MAVGVMAGGRAWAVRTRPAAAVAPFGVAVAALFAAGTCATLYAPWMLPGALSAVLLAAGIVGWWWGGMWRCAGALLAGAGWAALHAGWVLGGQLPLALEGQTLQVSGVVAGLPEAEARRTRFQLRVDADATQVPALQGRLLQLAWYDDFGATGIGPRHALKAGSRWQFQVKLRAPRGLQNPGGFDAERHALARRLVATGLVRPGTEQALMPPRGIDAWRERMATRIDAAVVSHSSRYVRALALGDTRALADGDWHILRATGLTHLIAISGFHVGMVARCVGLLAALLWRLAPWLGRVLPRPQAAALAALAGAVVYAAVAGFSLPTVRTVLMIAVVVAARGWRRPLDLPGSLALAALAVLLWDPLSILMAGFWLSFAGVAWLLWCLPERQHWFRGFLAAQWVATLGLLPLTVMLFGQASAAGPLANLLAIPWWTLVVVPLALLGTALEALLPGAGGWAWQLSAACFDLSWPLFSWLSASCFALWWLPEAGPFALPLALAGALWLLLPQGVPGKGMALLLWLPLLWPSRELPAEGEFELQVFDVGQGLAVLVRTARHSLLYDTGPAVRDGFDAGERVVVPGLRALGVAHLDAGVISHGDADHAGGLEAVRAVVPVARWQVPPGWALEGSTRCVAGQRWRWDGVEFEFLHPTAGFPYLGNESSCVLRVGSAHGVALLTGDIGEVIERRLVRSTPALLKADVVLAPHHGSGGSSQASFIAATQARLVLVSAGHGNRFGHPRAEVVERWKRAGAEVLQTGSSGAVRVWLGKAGLQLRERRTWRPRIWDAAERARAAAILSPIEQAAMVPEG